MIARPPPPPGPPSSPLHQVYSYSFPGYGDIAYVPYAAEASLHGSTFHSDKRLKLQPQFDSYCPQSLDNVSNINTTAYGNMQQSQLRTQISSLSAPRINPKRSSQPDSPMTVATTASQHTTPSSSPSRVTIISPENPNSDWPLYDESSNNLAQEREHSKRSRSPQRSQHGRYQQPSGPQFNPIMLDTSSYASSGYYPGYMTNFPKPSQQPQRSPQHFLKPSYPKNHRELIQAQSMVPQEMSDDCDEPPALSPSSYKGAQSNVPSIPEGDYHSPITPVDSPRSDNGARTLHVRTPRIREDAYITVFGDHMDECLHFESDIQHPIPKLNRTISDAVEDELFHHDGGIEEYRHSPKGPNPTDINPQLAHYFQAAQKQHSLAQRSMHSQIPGGRETSPFRANSPFHPGRGPVSSVPPVRHSNFLPGYLTAMSQREQQKEIESATLLSQQLQDEMDTGNITPKTISPKDAMLEYPEPQDDASKMSLFAEVPMANGNGTAPSSYSGSELGDEEEHDFGSIVATSRRGSEASPMPSVDAYNFRTNDQAMSFATFPYISMATQIQPTSSDSPVMSQVSSQKSKPSSPMTKPVDSKADTGAYTCTDPGCSLRFPTPQKMQKHRREAHRNTPAGARHAGPHKCTRINPTTGKPCNTVFSRPYDLTRHEDTIHNTTREKVRCELCNDEKTFSRHDALTRHKKVKHGIEK